FNGSNIADASGNGYNGTVEHNNGGTNKSVTGHIDRGMVFDGDFDGIRVSSPSLNNLPAVSAAAWVRLSSIPTDGDVIVSKGGNNGADWDGWFFGVVNDSSNCDTSAGAYLYFWAEFQGGAS